MDGKGFKAKLSDFGFAKHLVTGESSVKLTHGTPEYLPIVRICHL